MELQKPKPPPATITAKTAELDMGLTESQESVLDQMKRAQEAAMRGEEAPAFYGTFGSLTKEQKQAALEEPGINPERDPYESAPEVLPSGYARADEDSIVPVGAELEEKPARVEVVSVVDWIQSRGHGEINAYYMAMRALQGSLMYRKTPLAGVMGGFAGEEATYRILFIDHSLSFSTKKAARAWNEVLQASQEQLRSMGKNETKEYRGVIRDAELAYKHKKGAENTFLYGFRVQMIEAQDDDIHVYALGMATYREPKPLLRGEEAGQLQLAHFAHIFRERGGHLSIADIPKFIRAEAGYAGRNGDLYFEDRSREAALQQIEQAHAEEPIGGAR